MRAVSAVSVSMVMTRRISSCLNDRLSAALIGRRCSIHGRKYNASCYPVVLAMSVARRLRSRSDSMNWSCWTGV